jgi:hypothetical protein
MPSSGMLRRVALVRIDVSEELSASFIRVTGIGELGTTLAVTSPHGGICLRRRCSSNFVLWLTSRRRYVGYFSYLSVGLECNQSTSTATIYWPIVLSQNDI